MRVINNQTQAAINLTPEQVLAIWPDMAVSANALAVFTTAAQFEALCAYYKSPITLPVRAVIHHGKSTFNLLTQRYD